MDGESLSSLGLKVLSEKFYYPFVGSTVIDLSVAV